MPPAGVISTAWLGSTVPLPLAEAVALPLAAVLLLPSPWPISCCSTGSSCSALACCSLTTRTSPVLSARRSSSAAMFMARCTTPASPRITIELLLSTGRIDSTWLPPSPRTPNSALRVAAISRAELLRRVRVSMLALSLSICATSERMRAMLSL